MSLQFWNTLKRRREEFKPGKKGKVSLYVCGVTVYDDCHVGHARGAVVFDVLRRFLTFRGFQVTHVRNITDVDDKIIDRARKETGLTGDLNAKVKAVAERYTESFQKDFARLGLLSPHHEPKATEYIPQMQAFIQNLIERGMAYPAADGVYFSVRKFPEYGALSHQNPDQMLEGVRFEAGEGKKDPLDFALWKTAKPEEPRWDSPWGPGRPGWHIECSTMSTMLLEDEFDIHGGGQDLVFPHHENELAQSRGAGKPFARVWLHNGLLTVDGQKMSKSLGNFVTIRDALEKHSADVLRFFFLSAHYRSPVDFTWDRLNEAARAYERLDEFLARVDALGPGKDKPIILSDEIQKAEQFFLEELEDDLNTPNALAELFSLVRHANESNWLNKHLMDDTSRLAASKIRELGRILGFFQNRVVSLDEEVTRLLSEREEARKRKDFSVADSIRRRLIEMGYVIEDTAGKPVVRKRV